MSFFYKKVWNKKILYKSDFFQISTMTIPYEANYVLTKGFNSDLLNLSNLAMSRSHIHGNY
jgi:hypothetical protein